MRKKTKIVFGYGVNDADYQVSTSAVIDGRKKTTWRCPFYSTWTNMLERCYSAKHQDKNPTYDGCSVTPEWHSFMAFRAWMLTQPWEGSELDKDILIPGNKVYSPERCVFVPGHLNNFLTDCGAARGEWPLGVYWNNHDGKFHARCSNPFARNRESLGYFTDPAVAHEAWRRRKHELACQYADMQSDPRIANALRGRYVGV